MATLSELFEQAKEFRLGKTARETVTEVVATLLRGESPDHLFPALVWLNNLSEAEQERLEDLAHSRAMSVTESLAGFVEIDEREFDGGSSLAWKLGQLLEDRELLEGSAVMLSKVGKGERLRRELDLLDTLHADKAGEFARLLMPHLDGEGGVEQIPQAALLREVTWQFHDTWWGQSSEEDHAERRRIDAEIRALEG